MTPTPVALQNRRRTGLWAGGLLGVFLLVALWWAWGKRAEHLPNIGTTNTPAVAPHAGPAPAGQASQTLSAPGGQAPNSTSGPLAWRDLRSDQQLALAPLQGVWAELAIESKRKWMVMSKNFAQISAEEQSKLQSRMKAWADLPRQERIEARLNYLATQKIAPELKTQQWEAYQQLSAEEKQKLAAKAPAVRVQPGVTVSKPSQGDKLADVPVVQHPYEQAPEPGFKLAVPAQSLDRKTLLPTAAAAEASASTH